MGGEQPTTETQLAVMNQRLETIEATLSAIVDKLENHYVTQDQFKPVKNVVYGMTGLMLVAIVGALIKLVIK